MLPTAKPLAKKIYNDPAAGSDLDVMTECQLLQEELFHGQSFPSELGDVGLRIEKSCGGLPFSIFLVAGVLKEKKKKADYWKEAEESLSSHSIESSEESMSIIGFSYQEFTKPSKTVFSSLEDF
ncbi:hypothetical protein HAX54_047382 [Datura stramonium]|uniref:NB-ARC domain-containing protein n=1 Tax=Datura stramonium TaxID=4076 RepID=A0ABS8WI60_DATST|nr:hypothetical protein [Datura stramonium]